jgi:DNA-binding transcriptional LysR family regulator
MQMDAIQLICDVAQHRSVSRGAEMHGVTQSAASQRIRALERELGVDLIDTSTRPLQLTPAGEEYYHGCRSIIESYDRLRERVTGIARHEALRGEVSIAAIYSAGIDLLNQIRADFERANPRVSVTIRYLQPDDVADQVRSEQVDLGVISYPERWRDLASIPLREEIMVLVVRGDHALAGRESMLVSELNGLSMVGFLPTLPIARRIRRYLAEHGAEVEVEHEFDNIDTIKNAAMQTGTAAILPRRTVRREVEQGLLRTVALEPVLRRPIAIVQHRHREQSAVVRAFINYMVEHKAAATTPSPASVKADALAASA